MTTHTRQEEIDMMSGSGPEWPAWPRLPIVRRHRLTNGQADTGYLLYGHGPIVCLVNIYDARPMDDVPQQEYTSFTAIVDDGWEVD